MSLKANSLSVSIEPGVTEEERLALERVSGSHIDVTEKRGITGETAAWVLVTGFAVQALPHILAFLIGTADTKKVKRIKCGNFEVENPTPEMISVFMEKLRKTMEDGNVE